MTYVLDSFVGGAGAIPNPPWSDALLDAITMTLDGSGNAKASGLNTTADTLAYRNDATFNADQVAYLTPAGTYASTANYAAPAVRCSGSGATGKCYYFFNDFVSGGGSGHCGLGMYFNGVFAGLAAISATVAAGSVLGLRAVGPILTCYDDGVAVFTYDTSSDANKILTGAPGFILSNFSSNTALAAAWEGGDPVVPPPLLGNLFVGPIGFGR